MLKYQQPSCESLKKISHRKSCLLMSTFISYHLYTAYPQVCASSSSLSIASQNEEQRKCSIKLNWDGKHKICIWPNVWICSFFFFRPTSFFFICFSWISLPNMGNHKTATTTTSTAITAAKIDNGKCFPYYWILGSQRCGWQYGQGYMKGFCHNVGWCLLILLYNIQ